MKLFFTLFFLLINVTGFSLYAQVSGNPNPKILFLNFHISKNAETGEEIINLVNSNLQNGSMKKNNAQQDLSPEENDWIVTVVNTAGKTISAQTIADPLLKEYEASSQKGNIESHMIQSAAEDFTIRIPYNPSVTRIIFQKYSANAVDQATQTFDLNTDK